MFIESFPVPGLVLLTSDYLIAHHHSVRGAPSPPPLHTPSPPDERLAQNLKVGRWLDCISLVPKLPLPALGVGGRGGSQSPTPWPLSMSHHQ